MPFSPFLRRFGELSRASTFWLFGCLAFASDVPTGEIDFGLLPPVEGKVCGLPPGQGGPGALRRCLIICALVWEHLHSVSVI